jgi:hypothetical protein
MYDKSDPVITLGGSSCLTINLLMTTIVALPSNASKWQTGFNSAFKGLIQHLAGGNISGVYYCKIL